jgi:hypothetical protein
MQKLMENILLQYKIYYKGQENYYHNFEHATWVVKKGLEILEKDNCEKSVKEAYIHAMACHDAGHLNGLQKNDRENVDRALFIYKKHQTNQNEEERKLSSFIIDATCFPYIPIDKLKTSLNILGMWQVVKVARDVDRMGIIGREDKGKREKELTGLMREFLQTKTKKDLLSSYQKTANIFFDNLSFYTPYAKEWADKNLEKMKRWQIQFTPEAIERASR